MVSNSVTLFFFFRDFDTIFVFEVTGLVGVAVVGDFELDMGADGDVGGFETVVA